MTTKNDRAKLLANKWLNKTITPEEEQEFNAWYQENLDEPVIIPEEFVASEEEHRLRIFQGIKDAVYKDAVRQNNIKQDTVVKKWLNRIVAAASIIIVAGVGLWIYNALEKNKLHQGLLADHEIKPGRNQAILTLPNGKTMNLSEAKTGVVIDATKLTYNDGSLVQDINGNTSVPDGTKENTSTIGDPSVDTKAQLTLSTPRGGTYQVILPDGTKVWLNADSKITFPKQFAAGQRKVSLIGEAYFEVAMVLTKDKGVKHKDVKGKEGRMPFIVESEGQKVEVLGTHFNVNAYLDEPSTKTTLLEGAVMVSGITGKVSKKISPGQQSIFNKQSDKIQVLEVDLEEAVAWKNGYFKFNDEPLESIMRKISRWYNVEIRYNNNVNPNLIFGGRMSKFDNISTVLETLELTGGVHFKIEERRVTVMK